MNLVTSRIQKDELSILMQEEAFKEGWSYSQEDVNFYYHCPQNCIYAVKVDGQLAGCVILHQSLGHIQGKPIFSAGLFLVLREYRGKKTVGPYLWEHGITAHIGDDSVACFHAVPRAVDYYDRLNFKRTPLVDRYMRLEREKLNSLTIVSANSLFANRTLRLINENRLDDIEEYNHRLFPDNAGLGLCEFVRLWNKRPDAIVIGYYHQDILQGYGVATVCKKLPKKTSYRIAPLYASTVEIAQSILKGLIQFISKYSFSHIELNTLATVETQFGAFLEEIGFIEGGMNFVLCNKPGLVTKEAPILKHVFCSIPLEYPHEVIACSGHN